MSTALLEKNNSKKALESTSLMREGYTEYYNPLILDLTELEEIKPSLKLPWLILPLSGKEWLPQRLTNPLYGREILDAQISEWARGAPSVSLNELRERTKDWPSLSKIIIEERNNE